MPAMTSKKPAAKELGRYLYAVLDGAENKEYGPFGIDGTLVYVISAAGLTAVVSDVPNGNIRPERRKLAAHHDVLQRLFQEHTLLPMSFGIIADDTPAIRRILTLNHDALAEQLRRVRGKMEMGLRVLWDVPNIFEYIVGTHPELRALRDHLFRPPSVSPSQDDLIELGRTFDRIITAERAATTEKVMGVLHDHCAEFQENKPRNDLEIMNLACLIRRDAQKDFEEGVFEAAKLFDNHFAFDFNGPWPPHNFAALNMQL